MFTRSTTESERLEETQFFRIPRICLHLLGFWPLNRYRTSFVFLNLMAQFVAIVVEAAYGVLHLDDIPVALDAFCPMASQLVSFLKCCVIVIHREKFKCLLIEIRNWFRAGEWLTVRHPKSNEFEVIFNGAITEIQTFRDSNRQHQNLLEFNAIRAHLFNDCIDLRISNSELLHD